MLQDKAASHNYTAYYDVLLRPYVDLPSVRVLEVGVKMGGSMMVWCELFSNPIKSSMT